MRLYASTTARAGWAWVSAGRHGMARTELQEGRGPAQERCCEPGGEGIGRAGEVRGRVQVERGIKAAERKEAREETN